MDKQRLVNLVKTISGLRVAEDALSESFLHCGLQSRAALVEAKKAIHEEYSRLEKRLVAVLLGEDEP